ncbi:MAG: NUDIX domain-containing protein [Holophagaceae bacterium]|nr:NUDIX domain-containing protein [Holophagaceae bacterium]
MPAAAVASIAFQWPEPALEGNAFRVLARLLGIEGDPKHHANELRSWLRPALAKLGPSRITQSLMELGATICLPSPKCLGCPVADQCEAKKLDAMDRIPPAIKRRKPMESELWLVAVEAEGFWLLHEPAQKGLLAGLWKWPAIEISSSVEENIAADSSLPYASLELRSWPGWTQIYTHRRELVNPFHLRLEQRFESPGGCHWIPGNELNQLALGKRDQRLRELITTTGTTPLHGPAATSLLSHIKRDAIHVG